jgi:hypothetical protein
MIEQCEMGRADRPYESFAREMDYVKPEMNTFREARVGGEPKQPKNVAIELATLRENMEKAHNLLSVLEDRLRPIRCPAPQCAEKEGVPKQIGSELREAMAEQNMRLRALVGRISYMIDEIDL